MRRKKSLQRFKIPEGVQESNREENRATSDGPVQGSSPDGFKRPVRGKGFALFRIKGQTYLGERPDEDTGPIAPEDWEPSMQFIPLDGLPLFEWVDNKDV